MKMILSSLLAMGAAALQAACCDESPCSEKTVCPEKPYPKVKNCRDYNIVPFADFLYWRFSSPNLVYGRDGVGVRGAAESAVASGTSYYPDFEYDPGFKAGLGIKFGPSKAFDFVGIYCWLHSTPEGSISGSPISATFLPVNFFNSGTAATNSYSYASMGLDLTFNWAELQSGYSFAVNRYLLLRPYIALAAIFIDGDLDAHYEYTTPGLVFHVARTHGKCDSWSVGPKAGLDFFGRATDNWGVYLNVNLTQQISHIRMKTTETQEDPAAGTIFDIQKGRLVENRNIGLFSLEIGPTFDAWLYCDKIPLHLRATYGASNLNGGANLSFLNSNNTDLFEQSEFRGLNVRGLIEF